MMTMEKEEKKGNFGGTFFSSLHYDNVTIMCTSLQVISTSQTIEVIYTNRANFES